MAGELPSLAPLRRAPLNHLGVPEDEHRLLSFAQLQSAPTAGDKGQLIQALLFSVRMVDIRRHGPFFLHRTNAVSILEELTAVEQDPVIPEHPWTCSLSPLPSPHLPPRQQPSELGEAGAVAGSRSSTISSGVEDLGSGPFIFSNPYSLIYAQGTFVASSERS